MEQKLFGKDFVMFAEKGGLMVPVCCSRDMEISINADVNEATKPPSSVWKSHYYRNISYMLSTSGLVTVGDGYGIEDIYDAIMNRQYVNFIAREGIGSNFFLSGRLLVNNITVTGANKDLMTMSMSATGDGPLNRTKTLQTFPLVDGEGNTVVDGEGNTVVVAPNQYGTSTPIDISVDC